MTLKSERLEYLGMIRNYLVRVLFFFLTLFVAAFANAEKKPPMKAFAALTRAGPNFDFISKVPTNTVAIPTTGSLYKNDIVYYLPTVVSVVENDGDEFELKYKISIAKVGKASKTIADDTFKAKLPDKRIIIPLPLTIKYMFEDSDEYGTYELLLEVQNVKTGERAEAKTPIKLIEWVKPEAIKDQKEFHAAIIKYNTSFDPNKLYSIFTSSHMTFFDRDGNLAYAVCGFFKTAFKRNQFLLAELEKEFPSASENQRKNTIQLFEILGASDRLKGLDKSEETLRDSMREIVLSMPKSDSKPNSGAVLDFLWGEFFGSGESAPIEKIISCAIDNSANCVKLSELARAGKPVKEEMSDVEIFLGATAMSACWSLLSNCNANELAKKYISWNLGKMPKESLKAFNAAIEATSKYSSNKSKESGGAKRKEK